MVASEIANVGSADVDHVARMMFVSFRELSPDWLPTLSVAREKVADLLRTECFSRVMRDETGEIVGAISGVHAYGRLWELHPLVVAPHCRRRGYGRSLVEDLERHVSANGGLTLQLGTSDESDRTSLFGRDLYPDIPCFISRLRATPEHPLDFYRRLGFAVVGLIPDAEGPGRPSILMAKAVRHR
ncbi:MAG TPA: GNAT family N-acetyltransferase [Caulobacteraceae bacterium]